jgi:hypothetical protein
VGTGFEVEAEQLQRELRALGCIPAVKGRRVDGQRADGLIFSSSQVAAISASLLE